MNRTGLYSAIAVVAFATGYYTYFKADKNQNVNSSRPEFSEKLESSKQYNLGMEAISKAFQNRQSNVEVQAIGKVKAILPDDNEGSKHQKFILSLDNGLTVLVAHNIDLAPRIDGLQKGDMVEFLGEYEYSPKGGVIHWTHHDPQGRHSNGWLRYQGRTYQ